MKSWHFLVFCIVRRFSSCHGGLLQSYLCHCKGFRSSRMWKCFGWVVPEVAKEKNTSTFKIQAVKDKWLTPAETSTTFFKCLATHPWHTTSQETWIPNCIGITNTNWLMLLNGKITPYFVNHMYVHTVCKIVSLWMLIRVIHLVNAVI